MHKRFIKFFPCLSNSKVIFILLKDYKMYHINCVPMTVLKGKLRHIKIFTCLSEQKSVPIGQHRTEVVRRAPPTAARGRLRREKAGVKEGNY